MKTIIVTGSYGLIGSEVCRFYNKLGFRIIGIDNDMRKYFFGESSKEKVSNNYNIDTTQTCHSIIFLLIPEIIATVSRVNILVAEPLTLSLPGSTREPAQLHKKFLAQISPES
jgi:CDP-paratose 2-epimerase